MLALVRLMLSLVVDLVRPRAALEAELLVLRQRATDKLVLGWLCQLFPNVHNALTIVRPETVVRWHRAGFRSYWRWKSRRRAGLPILPVDIRQLIRETSIANPLWGARRIHGELFKLGIEVGQTSVAKYMPRRRGPTVAGLEDLSSQSCRWHRRHGPVRGANGFVPALVRSANHGSWPAADPMAWGNDASGKKADHALSCMCADNDQLERPI
jgi:hypothetical protein